MKHIFSRYPGGTAGAGLLLLRLHAVFLLIDLCAAYWSALALAVSIPLAAVALGLYARVATLFLVIALGASWFALPHTAPTLMAGQLCALLALALLGPGAISIDARRFGRKIINLS